MAQSPAVVLGEVLVPDDEFDAVTRWDAARERLIVAYPTGKPLSISQKVIERRRPCRRFRQSMFGRT